MPDDPDRILEIKLGFFEIHDSLDVVIKEARNRQFHDETVLQAQLFSRLGLVTQQIKDLRFATHRQIINRGLEIGNTAALCIIEADEALDVLSRESGEELMELAKIGVKDFLRIPDEFVYPTLDRTEALSQGFLNEVMLQIANENAVTNIHELVEKLEASKNVFGNLIPIFSESFHDETIRFTVEMNYVKAQIFPILDYTLGYFRDGIEGITRLLPNCTDD